MSILFYIPNIKHKSATMFFLLLSMWKYQDNILIHNQNKGESLAAVRVIVAFLFWAKTLLFAALFSEVQPSYCCILLKVLVPGQSTTSIGKPLTREVK